MEKRISYLYRQYLGKSLSEKELAELRDLLQQPGYAQNFEGVLDGHWESLGTAQLAPVPDDIKERIYRSVIGHEQQVGEDWMQEQPAAAGVKARRLWYSIAAVASIAVIIMGVWFFNSRYSSNVTQDTELAYHNDVAPGKNGATLTLANGQRIAINDALTGNIASQSGVKISKTADGELIYDITAAEKGATAYNTLATTRGEQIRLRLPDGSLVFLNAASSLKYPTSFANMNERSVELNGEGYFEVAKDKAHPFIVQTDRQKVEVLGTHFNINSYADEAGTRTTLVEGSVRVSVNGHKEVLKPSQQSLLYDGAIKVQPANVEEVVAWKNGDFVFNGEPLQDIMRKLSRWYNIDVVYKGDVANELYTAKISRNKNISEVIQLLEQAESVHFKIEGRRVIVTP